VRKPSYGVGYKGCRWGIIAPLFHVVWHAATNFNKQRHVFAIIKHDDAIEDLFRPKRKSEIQDGGQKTWEPNIDQCIPDNEIPKATPASLRSANLVGPIVFQCGAREVENPRW